MLKKKKTKENNLYKITIFEGNNKKYYYAYESGFKIRPGHIVISNYINHNNLCFSNVLYFSSIHDKLAEEFQKKYNIQLYYHELYKSVINSINEKCGNYIQYLYYSNNKKEFIASHFIIEKLPESKLDIVDDHAKTEEFNLKVSEAKEFIEKICGEYCETKIPKKYKNEIEEKRHKDLWSRIKKLSDYALTKLGMR
jgi:hypothetical protein